jgi:hypothetical protein
MALRFIRVKIKVRLSPVGYFLECIQKDTLRILVISERFEYCISGCVFGLFLSWLTSGQGVLRHKILYHYGRKSPDYCFTTY